MSWSTATHNGQGLLINPSLGAVIAEHYRIQQSLTIHRLRPTVIVHAQRVIQLLNLGLAGDHLLLVILQQVLEESASSPMRSAASRTDERNKRICLQGWEAIIC